MRSFARRTLSLTLLAALSATCGTALAANPPAPAGGLGESWPNASDVSSSSNWHVYVFQRGNTRYIQVNDAQGKVRGAFARTPYALVGLPIGSDAANLATPDEPLPRPASVAGETIYRGNGIQVFVAPQTDGTARLMAVMGDCTNPAVCSVPRQ